MPCFSIIVPIFNSANYLERCIESITAQTFTDFELILVDDGSTDCSADICERWSKKDPRIRVFHQENSGASAARNIGINNAKGLYIQLVDSDDTLEEDCLQTLSQIIGCYSYPDIVEFRLTYVGPNGIKNVQGTKLGDGLYERSFLENCFLPAMLQVQENPQVYYNIFNVLRIVKRDLLEKNGIAFNEKIRRWEDWLFAMEAFDSARSLAVTTKPLYNYYGHVNGGLGGRYNPDTYKYVIEAYRQVDQKMQGKYDMFSDYSVRCKSEQLERCIRETVVFESWSESKRVIAKILREGYVRDLVLNSKLTGGIFVTRPWLAADLDKIAVNVLLGYIQLMRFVRRIRRKLSHVYHGCKKVGNLT